MGTEKRNAYLREAPAFAAWLVIFLYAAAGRPAGGLSAWGWIGTATTIAALRMLVAVRGLDAPRPDAPNRSAGILYITFHVAQAALWILLLTGLPDLPRQFAVRAATSLAAATLLSAVCLRGWRDGWLAALAGWGSICLLGAIALWGSWPAASIGLLMWLAAAALVGLADDSAAPAGATRMGALTGPAGPLRQAGSTRRGVQLAIHAATVPMIGIHDGRIFDLNRAAEIYLGRTAGRCVGRAAGDLFSLDPPDALESSAVGEERFATVVIEPPDLRSSNFEQTTARIRIGRAGDQSMIAVMALGVDAGQPATPELGAEAQRVASWLGAADNEVWYRDESGRLFLPKAFDPGRPLVTDPDPDAFALLPLVPADDRAYVDLLYREQRAGGQTFDERITLIDAGGVARAVRVVCLRRTGATGPLPAVIGLVSISNTAARSPVGRSDLLSELPVLIWLVDASGRIVHAHASNVQRWGLRIEPRLRPSWNSSLAVQPASQEAFAAALQHALDGKPTFDLLNYRTGPSGGRLALRSHFVPFQSSVGDGKTRRAVMIMDTIASVRELLENERVRLSKAQYKDLVEASPNMIWACDEVFRFTFVSRRACRDVYGYTVEDLLGAPIGLLLDPGADQTLARQALVGLRNGRALRDVEMAHLTKDKRQVTVAVSAVALKSPDGNFAGCIGISVDITTLKQREARLAEALRVERSVLDSAGQAIAVVKAGMVARCNDAFLHLLQMRPEDLAAVQVEELFDDRSQWAEVMATSDRAAASDGGVTREIRVRRAGTSSAPGDAIWCQMTLRAIGAGEYVVALADIDLIRRREAHAQHDARHDELTGLPNRRLLSERVRAALATSALRNSGCAILVFDLDGFKPINDRYGHATGDVVLKEIAQRLQGIVRPQDTVARIGGDEFALLMPDCGEVSDVERIAQRILREVAQPLTSTDVGGACLSASLGVVMAPEHGRDPEWLMRLADRAMYDAKIDGGNRAMFSGSAASREAFPDTGVRRA